MRTYSASVALLGFSLLILAPPSYSQKKAAHSPRIQNARIVYFENQAGSDAAGKAALDELTKWGKYQIAADKKSADLILLLSADPYHGGDVLLASGQTGTIQEGGLKVDDVPNYNRSAPTRDVYLTVIDPHTGESLWSATHAWGGLLTGYNSAGARLIKKLESQTRK